MSLAIYLSNDLDRLAECLARRLETEVEASADPFHSPSIIVPNRQMQKWIELRLADLEEISVNLSFPFLETGLRDALTPLLPLDLAEAELKDETDIRMALLALLNGLDGKSSESDPLRPIQEYLRSVSDGGEEPSRIRKAWDLSERLASLFMEYMKHERDLLARWEKGDKKVESIEACEAELYRRVFLSGGRPWVTFPDLFHTAAEAARNGGSKEQVAQAPLHILCLPPDSFILGPDLAALSESLDLVLYLFVPFSGFWGGSDEVGEGTLRIKDLAPPDFSKASASGAFPTEFWSSSAKWMIERLAEIEKASPTTSFFTWCSALGEKDPPSILSQTKEILLDGPFDGKPDGAKTLPEDPSLRIVDAPSLYREVETVYHSILHNLREDESLSTTEIAVLVPSMPKYKTAFKSVFERGQHEIPYVFLDSNASEESLYGAALVLLLKMAKGNFTRREVVDLLQNPCFRQGAGLSPNDAEVVTEWIERLGIFRAFDEGHARELGYGTGSLYTWQQGLRRLRFGRIMREVDFSAPVERLESFEGLVPHMDLYSSGEGTVGRAGLALESLFRDLDRVGKARLKASEWVDRILEIAERHLGIPQEAKIEVYVKSRLADGLEAWRQYDALAEEFGGATEGEGIDFAISMVQSSLVSIPASKGKYLLEGVTIAALKQLRPMPFRIVYLLGLGEQDFPGLDHRLRLDLGRKGEKGRPSEARLREHLFLETLASVRDRLYLIYIGRDLQKDRKLYPSPLIRELKGFVKDRILDGEFETCSAPIHASSRRTLAKAKPGGPPAPPERFPDILTVYDEDDIKLAVRKEEAAVGDATSEESAVPSESQQPQRTGKGPISFSTRDLSRFLGNPIESAIRFDLGIWKSDEEGEDAMLLEDEPFEIDYGPKADLIGAHFRNEMKLLREDPESTPEERWEERYEHSVLRSLVPSGIFGKKVSDDLLQGFGYVLRPLLADPRIEDPAWKFLKDISIGSPRTGLETTEIFDPVRAVLPDLPEAEIRLEGHLTNVFQRPASASEDEPGLLSVVIWRAEKVDNRKVPKALMEPLLFYLMARAEKIWQNDETKLFKFVSQGDFEIVLAYWNDLWRFRIKAEPDKAAKYIENLLVDRLGSAVFDLIPMKTILEKDLVKEPIEKWIEKWNDADGDERRRKELLKEYHAALIEFIEGEYDHGKSISLPIMALIDLLPPQDILKKVVRRIELPLSFIIEKEQLKESKRTTKKGKK